MVKAVVHKVRKVTPKDAVKLLIFFGMAWLIFIILPGLVEIVSDAFAGMI